MTHDQTTTVRLSKTASLDLAWVAMQVGCRKGEAVELLMDLMSKDPAALPKLRELRLAKIGGAR